VAHPLAFGISKGAVFESQAKPGTGGQTGSFPSLKISNHYETNESCQTNIRKRSLCPRFPPISREVPELL